ncbi:hypothetical protein ONZ45_g9736 [Pleurotus djamor]|nr:hypothetical protein ONZ45_g9736 [Pleurotus djamor]
MHRACAGFASGTLLRRAESPQGWVENGCFTDAPGQRTLRAASTSSDTMTIEPCRVYPSVKMEGFLWRVSNGVVNASAISWCKPWSTDIVYGMRYALYRRRVTILWWQSHDCLNVYEGPASSGLAVPPTVDSWTYQGDSARGRTLSHKYELSGTTIDYCIAACEGGGLSYAGLGFGGECFCETNLPDVPLHPDSQCTTTCAGNPAQFCGGDYHPGVVDPEA